MKKLGRRNDFNRMRSIALDGNRKGKVDFTGQGPEQRSER